MQATEKWVNECRRLATTARAHCLHMTHNGKSGHVGSMFSMMDLLAVLYERVLRVDPQNPAWPDRDRFVLSKGHGAGGLYAILAEKGFFPQEWLKTFYRDGGKLMGHINHSVPGVEFSSGSLGHGLPVSTGMGLAARGAGKKHRIFCMLSEGDVDEGSTNEALMFAAQMKLDNLVAILDYNKVQSIGFTKDVLELEPLTDRIEAFRWAVREVDGHNLEEIERTLKQVPFEPGKPSWITAHTVKGKGVSFLENTVSCHYITVNEGQLAQALEELGVSS